MPDECGQVAAHGTPAALHKERTRYLAASSSQVCVYTPVSLAAVGVLSRSLHLGICMRMGAVFNLLAQGAHRQGGQV